MLKSVDIWYDRSRIEAVIVGLFERFVTSGAFFPTLITLLILLVLVFIWVFVSSKKTEKNKLYQTSSHIFEVAEQEIILPPLKEEQEEQETKILESYDIVAAEPEELTTEQEIKIEEKKDFPIEQEIPIKIEQESTFSFSNEIGTLQENKFIPNEKVEIPLEKTTEEERVAFNSEPSQDTKIKEDIVVEEEKEPFEKTEFFDFPDFSDIENVAEEEMQKKLEDEIIKTANIYIGEIMNAGDETSEDN